MGLPTREEILATLFRVWKPHLEVEEVPVEEAYQRVMAEDMFAEITLPIVRASTCDGVAVKSGQFAGTLPDCGQMVPGVDYVRADTGDDFPDDFDAVIRIEDVSLDEAGRIMAFSAPLSVVAGLNVRQRGTTVTEGELLVKKGRRLNAVDLSVLEVGGKKSVPVLKKPKVAFLPTGSELAAPGTVPERGQMIDTNSIFMKYSLLEAGCEPIMFPITRDDADALKKRFRKAYDRETDIIIINGGSSKGEEDLNLCLLEENGTVLYHWVGIVPGKPMAIALLNNGSLGIVLPGPSLAAFNGMEWLIKPLTAWMQGVIPVDREKVIGTLITDIKGPKDLEFLEKVNVYLDQNGECWIEPVSFKEVTMPKGVGANGFYYLVPGVSEIPAGTQIEVQLLCRRSELPVKEETE